MAMNLDADLRAHLMRHHYGKACAVKRDALLAVVRGWGYAIGDRDLREAYAELGAVAGPEGVWWPASWQEVEECARYLDDKAIGHFERAKHLREVHAGLRQVRQLSLFGGGA
jgi:hypothetical protein